ncbi:protein CREG1 precursor [Aphelenchoides avenae]|nr:protein CREG1 precursor [Aphelenchus avenae]
MARPSVPLRTSRGSFERTLKCVEGCPVGKYAALARTIIRTWNKYCGDNVPETTKEKFFADDEQFQKRFAAEFEKCKGEGAPDTPDKTCKWLSDCLFGSALTSAKSGVSDDVVSVTVNWQKIYNGALLETSDGENLPSSCELLLFKPSEPEAPYEPVPYPYKPYSYEHYQPEPYQRDPYQSNPYQRNPYQRNPYQRNPYQRNPYQHNSYQRSPYKRRN